MSLAWVKDSCFKGTVACVQTPSSQENQRRDPFSNFSSRIFNGDTLWIYFLIQWLM